MTINTSTHKQTNSQYLIVFHREISRFEKINNDNATLKYILSFTNHLRNISSRMVILDT